MNKPITGKMLQDAFGTDATEYFIEYLKLQARLETLLAMIDNSHHLDKVYRERLQELKEQFKDKLDLQGPIS
jgi:DNA gyrase/topoisomerase IV subunit A